MELENLQVDIDGPVATITLNRPHTLNALSAGLMADYDAALTALAPGDAVRVIRLRGAGRAFCPGYDLSPPPGERGSYGQPSNGAADVDRDQLGAADFGESATMLEREGMRQMAERWLRIWNYKKPVIAQVHGYCLSGGLDLLSTTDLAFAAAGTRFGHPASRAVGIPILMGMLPFKIGAARTKRILFTGDLIDAAEALEWGLVDWVVEADELDARTMDYCRRVALLPMDGLSIHKQAVNRWSELQGSRTASLEMVDMDALYHTTPAYHEFSRRVAEHGLQQALAWRDGPFKAGERRPVAK